MNEILLNVRSNKKTFHFFSPKKKKNLYESNIVFFFLFNFSFSFFWLVLEGNILKNNTVIKERESGLNLFLTLGIVNSKGEWFTKSKRKTEKCLKTWKPIWDQAFSL